MDPKHRSKPSEAPMPYLRCVAIALGAYGAYEALAGDLLLGVVVAALSWSIYKMPDGDLKFSRSIIEQSRGNGARARRARRGLALAGATVAASLLLFVTAYQFAISTGSLTETLVAIGAAIAKLAATIATILAAGYGLRAASGAMRDPARGNEKGDRD